MVTLDSKGLGRLRRVVGTFRLDPPERDSRRADGRDRESARGYRPWASGPGILYRQASQPGSVAEQSLYLWQRPRVERVQRTEPEYLGQAIAGAHAALAEHWQADSELADNLHRTLNDYGALRPSRSTASSADASCRPTWLPCGAISTTSSPPGACRSAVGPAPPRAGAAYHHRRCAR
jgi:hypothetical protein